jgi:hypothetical protein
MGSRRQSLSNMPRSYSEMFEWNTDQDELERQLEQAVQE